MAQKYWRIQIKGGTHHQVRSTVGKAGGMLLRLHHEAGVTHAYFATYEALPPEVAKSLQEHHSLAEVRLEDAAKVS